MAAKRTSCSGQHPVQDIIQVVEGVRARTFSIGSIKGGGSLTMAGAHPGANWPALTGEPEAVTPEAPMGGRAVRSTPSSYASTPGRSQRASPMPHSRHATAGRALLPRPRRPRGRLW